MLGAMSAPSGAECQRSPLELYNNQRPRQPVGNLNRKIGPGFDLSSNFWYLGVVYGMTFEPPELVLGHKAEES